MRRRFSSVRQTGHVAHFQVADDSLARGLHWYTLRRLNEVALPSATATDASPVVVFRTVVHWMSSWVRSTEQFPCFSQVSYFQEATIQTP